MAIYKQLSIAAGGGVISGGQQADQVRDTATILIGLGGTGNDCIRTIKTQVYSRLKPDDPDAVVKTYDHIRFLGLDTDEGAGGDAADKITNNAGSGNAKLALDDTEKLSIANGNLAGALAAAKNGNRRELAWLNREIPAPDLGAAGAGGIRQAGRFMMMDRSQAFKARLADVINSAKEGLIGDHIGVNIHIFAGIGGGTGSGTFLDVCYMVREVCRNVPNTTIFGYVFLPDVNLSNIPAADHLTRSYIRTNGYAAMQEIDYCMQLQYNGGDFEQEYQGAQMIPWNGPPVDMCHLVCATNEAGNVIPNAYEYAMHVTSEYIMDFLTHSSVFGLAQNHANFQQKIVGADAKKEIGSFLGYCVIGASCARLPLREINTYLASELFEKFSRIGGNVPTQRDVELLALSTMAPGQQEISEIYNELWRELYNGAFDGYNRFEDDWKDVLNGDEAMVKFYTNQNAEKLRLVETGAKSLMDASNAQSLFARMKKYLESVIGDVTRGPIFAHGMLNASEKNNLLNIIDGFIEENKARWDQEAFQDRYGEYEYARDRFRNRKKNGLFESDKARFEEYRYRLEVLAQHDFWLKVFEQMDTVLRTFRGQVEGAANGYYIKLARVMKNLIDTFAENRDTLHDPEMMQSSDAFAEPLVTIQELSRTLEAEVERIDVPGTMKAFMGLFLDKNNEDKWLKEDESEISKLVNDFFVYIAFADFANRSMTAFLKDKYNTTTEAELAEKVYQEWMTRLSSRAKPLFFLDSTVWSQSNTSALAYLSYPASSGPVQTAAQKMQGKESVWQPKPSALNDRIFMMRSACALPLCSYHNCREYEQECFATISNGRYYYEGNAIEGMAFDDWRKLPSLTPQSLIDMEHAPYLLKERVEEARALYERAAEAGLFSDTNKLKAPLREAKDKLVRMADEAVAFAATIRNINQKASTESRLEELRAARKALPMIETPDGMANDGLAARPEVRLRVQKDHFVSAPVYQMKVAKTLEELDALDAKIAEAETALVNALDKIDNPALPAFLNALFTGVFKFTGKQITYRPSDAFDDEDVITLTRVADEYRYNSIPVYQAFLSFQELPVKLQAEIRGKTNELLNNEDPSIAEATKALLESISENKLGVWARMANTLESTTEIKAFLREVRDRFETHKMQYLDA